MGGIVTQNISRQSGLVKAPEAGGTGAWTFISKTTASSSATVSITSGIDTTYKFYLITYNNIHPQTDNTHFTFNGSIDSGSNYNVSKQSTHFAAYSDEGDSNTSAGYETSHDLANGTGVQNLLNEIGNDNDQSASGYLYLWNPASTVFMKHFMSVSQLNNAGDYSRNQFVNGYFNTTSAIDAVQFKQSSGNLDSGDICVYGLST
jgi:hypothetical protein